MSNLRYVNPLNVGRAVLWVVLLIAVLGPWLSSSDGVPPPEWCADPLILENGHCIRLVPGTEVLFFMTAAFFSMSFGLFTGVTALPDRAGELLGTFLFAMLWLPFFTTVFLIFRGNSRRLRGFHMIFWGFAALFSQVLILASALQYPFRYWGLWLYCGVTASGFILEIVEIVLKRRAET